MAVAASITSALCLHSTLSAMALIAPDEDRSTLIGASLIALDDALAIPAQSFSDVRMKLAALMSEAGPGPIEVDDLAYIARDLDALLGRFQ